MGPQSYHNSTRQSQIEEGHEFCSKQEAELQTLQHVSNISMMLQNRHLQECSILLRALLILLLAVTVLSVSQDRGFKMMGICFYLLDECSNWALWGNTNYRLA